MFPVEVRFDTPPPRLVSGLVARLRLAPATSAPPLTYVPMAALVEGNGDRASVFVIEGGKARTIARKRDVRVAFITADSIALESGLASGETVITDGALFLENGEPVEVLRDCRPAGREPRNAARGRLTSMSFLEFPIRRYQFTLVAFMCLIALGWYAFTKVPREEDPYFKIPGYTIAAIYPGADPKDLERLVSKPIEDKLAALDDVMKIETSIRDGVSFIAIEFETTVDPDKKFDEVTREVNALRPDIPPRPRSSSGDSRPASSTRSRSRWCPTSAVPRARGLRARVEGLAEDRRRRAHGGELGVSRARAAGRASISSACPSSTRARAGDRRGAERKREHTRGIHRSRAAQLSA
jgi:hypothetical protein